MDSEAQLAFAKSLLEQNTVVELDGISQNTSKFLVPLLCHWVYSVRLASSDREKLSFVIFLEEAHHVLYRHEGRAKETLMNGLLRQCRELGIGVVIIDQHPHLISSAGIGNCYTTICMNQKDPSDINKAASLSALEDSDKQCFNRLPVGQGVVKLQDRWRQPFLVQFPLVQAKKGIVTDKLLEGAQTGRVSWQELRERAGVGSDVAARSRGDAILAGHDPQASFTHEYWKGRLAAHFEQRGFEVMLEAQRENAGGNMDILARRAAENVAIEVETGKSDVVSNVKRDLLGGVNKVIVVATDEEALGRIERQLARAGLFLPGRLEVVLRDAAMI